ncbi:MULTISPECIES: replicative DNA helicase [unclassified Serratia (in: enterobacteria)]|uniref:replicative DNA helicase n=1 Tax=unclassified Serratia (in: enterobacteria) TaxID=2647522 RepID=UPI000468B88D|nr:MULTISPECIES: replicative DNA helicase [unclassified Serratia (in: enterobacteria)]
MNNMDIEASVIGGLLIGGLTPNAVDVLATLDPDAFFVPLYRETFKEIIRQANNRGMIDALMVAEGMGEGNFANIMETARHCPSAANLKGYARVVGEYHQIREFTKLMESSYDLITGAQNHERALEGIQAFSSKIFSIAKPHDEHRPIHIRELAGSYAEVLEQRNLNGEESDTLKTGIPELDEITGGINPVDLVVVAARPGMGKTEFAIKVAEGVAETSVNIGGIDKPRGVLIFSMEMSAHQVIERQLANASNIPVSVLRNPAKHMEDEEWARVSMGIKRLINLQVWVVDASNLTIEQIRAIAERLKLEHPELSLILADYLGLIKKPSAERNDLAIAHITGGMKRMAKDLKTPVMALSQLSRDVEKRPMGQRRPTNSDLRDSGSIEQDADSIIMLYREAAYQEDSPAAPFAEIIVTKNRFGIQGTVYQEFKNGHFMATDQAHAAQICRAKPQQAATGRRYAKRDL